MDGSDAVHSVSAWRGAPGRGAGGKGLAIAGLVTSLASVVLSLVRHRNGHL